ncbi:binding-protein-dependent transport system inner membrane component [mine drainage metagenome]|uniref:Binding-protein-dependent transport system inner membrane component n=1 Tax=mine drainage metagenome TaxID=410659 RepID=T1B3G3_9ZZZZ
MRITDIFLSIPYLLFIIVVLTVFSQLTIPGLAALNARILLMILAFIIVWWPTYARIVRGQVLVVREQKYVEAARASGAGRGRLLLRHILPNSMYPVFIQMSLDVGTVPILIGSLSFLGFNLFGIPFTQVFPEWGSLAAYSIQNFTGILGSCAVGTCIVPWWQIFFPGIMLFLFAISVNFFADGLRDALDPRLRR